ncbi:MAG: type I methionyl aminopeptidase [Pirellulales bacterium]
MLQNNRKLQLGHVQREAMREAGRFNAKLMDYLRGYIQPGITTGEIDRLAHDFTIQSGHTPATLGYHGFPKSCCTSINDVICHGIPGDVALREGDIINVDITTIVDGWHGDQSETFLVGQVSDVARAVTQCAFDCLYAAIDALSPGCPVSVIGDAVVALAHERGFSVVKEYVGHGLGKRFHQYPNIPHVADRKSRTERLLPGICFTVEPMINEKSRFAKVDADTWTVRTRDGGLSAQFEHSILMTEEGPEILTQTEHGPKKGHTF